MDNMITTLLQDQTFLAAGFILCAALLLLLWLLRQLWHHEGTAEAVAGLHENEPPIHAHDVSEGTSVTGPRPDIEAIEKRLDDIIRRLDVIEQRLNTPAAAPEASPPLSARDMEKFIQRLDARVELLAGDAAAKEEAFQEFGSKIDAVLSLVNKPAHE